MLNLCFTPYFTTIQAGKLDLCGVSPGKGDEDLIVIRSPEDHVFYIADADGFSKIIESADFDKNTPEGRRKLADFYSTVYDTTREAVGKYICSVLAIRSWSAKVYLEPMQNSIKATVTPRNQVEEEYCQTEEWKPDLSDTIEQVLLGGLDYSVIGDFCDTMPVTEESLRDLKDAIEDYDILELYLCLFSHFQDKLSPDEIHDYRENYRQIFDKELYSLIDETSEFDTEEES